MACRSKDAPGPRTGCPGAGSVDSRTNIHARRSPRPQEAPVAGNAIESSLKAEEIKETAQWVTPALGRGPRQGRLKTLSAAKSREPFQRVKEPCEAWMHRADTDQGQAQPCSGRGCCSCKCILSPGALLKCSHVQHTRNRTAGV